jgi:hypothetical protein
VNRLEGGRRIVSCLYNVVVFCEERTDTFVGGKVGLAVASVYPDRSPSPRKQAIFQDFIYEWLSGFGTE